MNVVTDKLLGLGVGEVHQQDQQQYGRQSLVEQVEGEKDPSRDDVDIATSEREEEEERYQIYLPL